jgi:hypothetical protein
MMDGADFNDCTFFVGVVRKRRDGFWSGDYDVTARHIEESRNVGDILAALIAFPRHLTIQAQLSPQPNGNDGTYVSHEAPPFNSASLSSTDGSSAKNGARELVETSQRMKHSAGLDGA